MNKLMGFYELKASALPTIPWQQYTPDVNLDSNILWTIRSAVVQGNDLNLPRAVGKKADEAKLFANDLYNQIGQGGIVIYYPYFVAEKSGTLNVFHDKVIIEAVEKDLWNLVTNNNLDVSLTFDKEHNLKNRSGDSSFFTENEVEEILRHSKLIKMLFRDSLIEGKSVLLEWSFAKDCDGEGNPIGESNLVFYEVRTV